MVSTDEKARLLLDTHTIPPKTERTDQSYEVSSPASESDTSVTEEEVKLALFRPGSTAPGPDSLPNNAWKKAWKHFKGSLVNLFDGCVTLGHHPDAFKQAKMVAIWKPGRDRTSPQGYRLISLLSTLGKGLERLIASRLARDIILEKYICAVLKRAVTDLTLSLMDELESCLKNKYRLCATLLTFDVKGAFDPVQRGRMI